jgi:curved DNA-binding protein CbpA
LSVSDPYKVLQVDPEAEREVIEAAYRRLARKYHPDVSPDPDSHEKMIAINHAWEQLRDPVKRASVDRARLRASGTAAWIAAAEAQARTASAPPPRNTPPIFSTPSQPLPAAPKPSGAPSQPSSAPEDRPASSTWPFGMSDPAEGRPTSASQAGARAWTSGRVPLGGSPSGAASVREGDGAAGAPPGNPSGSVLNFGRFSGWSLGEIARTEIDYLEWLDRMPIGRTYQAEIDELLRARGRRSSATADQGRGGAFRRR